MIKSDFEERTKKHILEVILLCKGYYNKEKYPTVLDALKQYYRNNYSFDYEDALKNIPEEFLLKNVLKSTITGISIYYSDRMFGFINGYILGEVAFLNIKEKEEWFYNYEKALFYRIISFLKNLNMHGPEFVDIDSSEYISHENGISILIKDIIN